MPFFQNLVVKIKPSYQSNTPVVVSVAWDFDRSVTAGGLATERGSSHSPPVVKDGAEMTDSYSQVCNGIGGAVSRHLTVSCQSVQRMFVLLSCLTICSFL